jgi:hypothetical protein
LNSHRAWVDQQLACTLYDYMTLLAEQTGKAVYRGMAEWIAYTILLPCLRTVCGGTADRWIAWKPISGCSLTVPACYSNYEATGRQIFLEAARRTLQTVLDDAQLLGDGLRCFLHDTLEEEWSRAREIYLRLFRSTVMGESPGNTLGLNTHVWTLVLLHRFAAIDPEGPYAAGFDGG